MDIRWGAACTRACSASGSCCDSRACPVRLCACVCLASKQGKLGDRKDSNNNAANKLSQKMFAENPRTTTRRQTRMRTRRAKGQIAPAAAQPALTPVCSSPLLSPHAVEFLSRQSLEPKTLGNSATARKREALEKAREKLNLLLTGACGSPECPHGSVRDASQKLLICKGCQMKAYCDAACQKADWKAHKEACKAAAARKAEEAEAEKAATLAGKKGSAKEKEPLAITAAMAASSIAEEPAAAAAASSSSGAPAAAASTAAPAPAAASSSAATPAATEGDALD